MRPNSKAPNTTLITEDKSPLFYVKRFEGRKYAVRFGPHRHRFLELVIIERGIGSQVIEGVKMEAHAGDVFIITPGETHDPDGLDPTTHWIVGFDLSFISHKIQHHDQLYSGLPSEVMLIPFTRPEGPGGHKVKLSEKLLVTWIKRLNEATEEFTNKKMGFGEYSQAILSQMLIDLARLTESRTPIPTHANRAKLGGFFAVLEEKFRKPTNLNILSKSLSLSSAYLTDLVRKETGKTAMEWLQERRINEAKQLLRETQSAIKEISYDVGYRDPGLFIRHFSRQVGHSPAQWRKMQVESR